MELNYDFLKENVVMVEVIKDINMGPIEDFLDGVHGVMITGLKDDDGDAIIETGTKGEFNVQPHNGWYEMSIDNKAFDIAIDGDQLNEYIKGLKIIGPNKHFFK